MAKEVLNWQNDEIQSLLDLQLQTMHPVMSDFLEKEAERIKGLIDQNRRR